MPSLCVLKNCSYTTVSIIYVLVFQSVLIASLKLESNEVVLLQSERTRREASPADVTDVPSPCPEDQLYCEEAEDYPSNKIEELLKKQPKFILDHFYDEDDSGTGESAAAGEEEEGIDWQLCSSSNQMIYPKKARSIEGPFEFIVNDDTHKQGVRVERCMFQSSEGAADTCSFPGSLSLGYKSSCVQKHIQRTMVVFGLNNTAADDFGTKYFEFPSCCSCKITLMEGDDVYDSDLSNNSTTELTYNDDY